MRSGRLRRTPRSWSAGRVRRYPTRPDDGWVKAAALRSGRASEESPIPAFGSHFVVGIEETGRISSHRETTKEPPLTESQLPPQPPLDDDQPDASTPAVPAAEVEDVPSPHPDDLDQDAAEREGGAPAH